MARYLRINDNMLAMALVGYEKEKSRIEAATAQIQAQLGQRGGSNAATGETEPARKRVLSAAARRRMAAAQKKRWAAYKKAKAEPERPKRVLSAAGRKAIADAARRRWALQRKKTKAA